VASWAPDTRLTPAARLAKHGLTVGPGFQPQF
jgi:hypothetical protein